MIFEKENNITHIKQDKVTVQELIKKLEVLYERFKNDNVIVSLINSEVLTADEIDGFIKILDLHKEQKHSFVIVTNQTDLDAIPENLIVVPSVQEAHDIIEMEEMERDLGF
ncbi:ribonuclease Z [Bizionia sp. KMM 8389]